MKIELFEAPLGQVIFRLYLMMIVVIVGGLMSNIGIMASGMLVFLTALLALRFDWKPGGKSKMYDFH